jgi:hypothetical protein
MVAVEVEEQIFYREAGDLQNEALERSSPSDFV